MKIDSPVAYEITDQNGNVSVAMLQNPDRYIKDYPDFIVRPLVYADSNVNQKNLSVWYGKMPESNGKTNWTAILYRKGDGILGGMEDGFTIDRSEYEDRVRYEADRVRYLIGEIDKKPWILDYDSEKHSGYVAPELTMNRIFVDMDGVLVDFEAHMAATGLTGDELKKLPGAYAQMPAIDGAIEAVRILIGMGFDVWIATKPPTGIHYAYGDKAKWIIDNIPELKTKIIITHDKGLLGDEGDFLCDDRPHKANCERFKGTLLRFIDGYHWPQALAYFRLISKRNKNNCGA